MNKNKKNHIKPRYVLWSVIGICLVCIAMSVSNQGEPIGIQKGIRAILVPMEKGLNTVGTWVAERQEYKRSVEDLLAQIDQLEVENGQLKTRISSMENNLSELESLRDLLKMKEIYPDYEMVGARIISKDAGNWYNEFIIDKGSNDGIQKDMNVIYDNGLVGIVSEVSANNATVRAIIDDTSSVSGMFTKSTELCIVNGDLTLYEEGLLNVEMISPDAVVTSGDEVVTSYISDKYLPGLVIGYITDVTMDNDKLSQSAKITPRVSFDNITNVMIITQLKADMISSAPEMED